MKKSFRRADGSEEIVEGTPEEISEYERISGKRDLTEQPKKPGVLKGRPVDGTEEDSLLERLRRRLERSPTYGFPIWMVSCPICHRINCAKNHWSTPDIPILTDFTFTTSSSCLTSGG